MIIMERQLFCNKKDNSRGVVISVRRYMEPIVLYYKNNGIEEDKG